MLPAHIKALLVEQIQVDLRTKGTTPRDVQQRAAVKAQTSGLQPAGHFAIGFSEEINTRAKIITEAIRLVLGEVRVTPYAGLSDDLVGLFDAEFNGVIAELRPKVVDACRTAGITGDGGLARKIEDWRAVGKMNLKLLGAAIMEPARQANSTTFTINNSQVGGIQTGDGAVIETGISIASADSARLTQALSEIKNALHTIPTLDETKRAELHDVATEVEAEIIKPKPNSSKVGALLSTISASIKGVNTLTTAYETILHVMKALGIQLVS